jgi:hypothetical protein
VNLSESTGVSLVDMLLPGFCSGSSELLVGRRISAEALAQALDHWV